MKTIIKNLLYLLAVISSLMICSCADDFPYHYGEIPEGEGALAATITFTPTSGVNLATRTEGEAIQTIESLAVLVYPTYGELVRTYYYNSSTDTNLPDYNCNPEGYEVITDPKHPDYPVLDGTDANPEESYTPQAKFTLSGLPYGRYRIYAVANVPDLLTNPKYTDAIKTAEGLKGITFTWNPNDIGENNQMFGTFGQKMSTEDLKKNDPIVEFKPGNTDIHAWVRRLASKVTVAFDGSGLYQNVWIYIKNVTIHDIPKSCTLGDGNKVTDDKDLLNRKTNNNPNVVYTPQTPNTRIDYAEMFPGGDKIYYPEQSGIEIYNGLITPQGKAKIMPNKWKNTNGEVEENYNPHGPNAESLFFYENNQGDFDGQQDYNKQQQRPLYDSEGNKINDGVGSNVREPQKEDGVIINDYKDRVENGTYIEVEAYYVSANSDNPSEGNIKYRFMLGKNVTYNYDAQRNYHFKVTLGFKGWANEPDWHIDFDEPEPSIEVPPVFRISYLYHEKAKLPIKINGNCIKLEMKIIENNWAPYDPNQPDEVPPAIVNLDPDGKPNSYETLVKGPEYGRYNFQWNKEAWTSMRYNGTDKPYLGFLALHMPADYQNQTAIPTGIGDDGKEYIYNFHMTQSALDALENYYYAQEQDYRTFDNNGLADSETPYDSGSPNEYTVEKLGENQHLMMVPLWTRARTMIEGAGFSGNNPYEYYERKAVVKITATFRYPDGHTAPLPPEYVTVLQVPRIVNPKGIWRSSNSESFHVLLKQAVSPNGMSNFATLKSQGDWSAYVEAGNAVTLSKSATTIGEIVDPGTEAAVIQGKTGTDIDFNIDFVSTGYAIVTVLYHGNNCVHKIFVRKGFDNMVNMGGNEWSSFSLYATEPRADGDYTAILTANPLALGSYFRRGRLDNAILVQSNNGEEYSGFSPLGAPDGHQFLVYNINNPQNPLKKAWYYNNNAGGDNTQLGFAREWGEVNDNAPDKILESSKQYIKSMGTFYSEDGNIEYQVPDLEDFQALVSTENNYQFGYGVLYGEEAPAPADKAEIAYRLFNVKNEISDGPYGMRGVIVYDPNDGDQIFFPVGAFGMGRRQQFSIPNATYAGTLRYADVYNVLSTGSLDPYRPVPYNLPIVPGAIYWINKWCPEGHIEGNAQGPIDYPSMGWDINYFNYDFNAYTQNNRRDACVIKLIRKKK